MNYILIIIPHKFNRWKEVLEKYQNKDKEDESTLLKPWFNMSLFSAILLLTIAISIIYLWKDYCIF